jgi:hypothetical protein
LNREWIYAQSSGILEQLCHNAIYADALAELSKTVFLINLVRKNSALDVENHFGLHLAPGGLTFKRATWEGLYANVPEIKNAGGSVLRRYLEEKTLSFRRAFEFNPT